MLLDRTATFSTALILLCGAFGAQGQESYEDNSADSASVGDAYCDSELNTDTHNYDGGDCCICTCFSSTDNTCGENGFECVDPEAADSQYDCEEAPTEALPCPAGDLVHTWTVDNTSQARRLADATNCSGGAFDVEWRGNVVVEKTIYITDGTVLNVKGAVSGAVVDGGGATRLFTVVNASLHLHNVNISYGLAIAGGAVWASGANLTFNGTSFVGNNASFGGGLFLSDGSVGFFGGDTLFTQNNAFFGGALYSADYCILSWNGSPTFTGNTAAVYGGALHAKGGSTISLEGNQVLFANNSATNAGGAMYVTGNATVNMNGGAIFVENSAASNSSGVGGAISVSDAGSNVSWSHAASFTGNTAYRGGALYVNNGACVSYDGRTDFVLNRATKSGGVVGSGAFGASNNAVESSLFIRAATCFEYNTAGGNGGGMALLGMLFVEFETTDKVIFLGNTAAVAGGAIFLSGAGVPPTFSDLLFSSNLAKIGGAVYAVASGIELTEGVPNPTTFIGCTFLNNSAEATGGAVESAAGRDVFNHSVFIGNSAGVGGALRLAGTVTVENCSFVDNVADEDSGPAVSNVGYIDSVTASIFDGNVFSCEPETFLDFKDSDDLYETVCSGCPNSCPDCEFPNPLMVPKCSPTAKYSSSPGGTATIEQLCINPGYWRATNRSLNVLTCHNTDACFGGLTGSKTFCEKGYEGPYCSVCREGYASSLGFACNKCSDSASGITLASVLGMATILAVAALVSYLLSGEQNATRSGIMGRILRFIPLQSIKIVIVSWQILTQIVSVANITYPSVYERFLNVVSALNFDLSWVITMGCILDVDFHDRLLIMTIGPFVALIFLGVTYTIAESRHRWSDAAIRTVRYKHASAVLLLTFLVYSSVSSVVFQMFSCERLDDNHVYLRPDYRIKCDSPKHVALQIYSAVMIIIYPLGIPSLYAILLLRNRDALKKRVGREKILKIRSISELWEPYRPKRYYYEVIECARRLLLSGLTVFINSGSSVQISITIVIAFGFFGIAEGLSPYESKWDSWISRSGHVIVFMSLYVALLLEVEISDKGSNKQQVFEVILVFAHGCLILAVVVESLVLACSLRSVPLEKPLPRFRSAKSFACHQSLNELDVENPFTSNAKLKGTVTVCSPCPENTIGAPRDSLFYSSSSDEDTKENATIPNDDDANKR